MGGSGGDAAEIDGLVLAGGLGTGLDRGRQAAAVEEGSST